MSNFLIPGTDYLKNQPKFNLVGRDRELDQLISILVRDKSSSAILSGPRGVGCEALVCGVQKFKSEPDVPFDVVSKRLFWIDSNNLFSSGDGANINTEFQKIMRRLERTTNAILVIEDTKDFLDSARNSGCSHFVNSIVSSVNKKLIQVILICSDDNLDYVLKSHNDFFELFTLMTLDEPTGAALKSIVTSAADLLSEYHDIKYHPDAIDAAIEQTTKYQGGNTLDYAQPKKAITLLDRAFSSYKLGSHKKPPKTISAEVWQGYQERLRSLYRDQRKDEDFIVDLEEKIVVLQQEKNPDTNPTGNAFERLTSMTGMDTPEITELRKKIKTVETDVEDIKKEFSGITTVINQSLLLDWDEVTKEFSDITGIPVDKLNEDETDKLRNMEPIILNRIYGQQVAVERACNAILTCRAVRKKGGLPVPLMLLGPSGVGKTEFFKALAFALYDDEDALLRIDMSEYMEKHAVAKLIGAPPGYEGFEVGGILTNAIRKNSRRVVLLDEIEKAHPDVFNVMLQVLGSGRLTDGLGRVARFESTIVGMTTNLGQTAFLDESLSDLESEHNAMLELESTYRSEFLNRFNGRENIIPFKRLKLDSIVKIVNREIHNIDSLYSPSGVNITIDDENLQRLCAAKYDSKIGARGLPGYINAKIEPSLARGIIAKPPKKGIYSVIYDNELNVKFESRAA